MNGCTKVQKWRRFENVNFIDMSKLVLIGTFFPHFNFRERYVLFACGKFFCYNHNSLTSKTILTRFRKLYISDRKSLMYVSKEIVGNHPVSFTVFVMSASVVHASPGRAGMYFFSPPNISAKSLIE